MLSCAAGHDSYPGHTCSRHRHGQRRCHGGRLPAGRKLRRCRRNGEVHLCHSGCQRGSVLLDAGGRHRQGRAEESERTSSRNVQKFCASINVKTLVSHMTNVCSGKYCWPTFARSLHHYNTANLKCNQVAMEMLFTGSPISAHDALLHGLVSKVVPEDRLEEETLAIARRVCQSSRPVVALGKATFYR